MAAQSAEMSGRAEARIVVIGAGFGGLWAAKRFVACRLAVTLLDKNNYHTFFPLLYQVAAAELSPSEIAYPIRSVFRNEPLADFRTAEVQEVDLSARVVSIDGSRLAYDYLVVALGSVPSFFGVEGAALHAFPLRTMDDAIPLRHHVLTCFERAAQVAEPELRRSLLRFTIVGGGATGVEYAGALAELIYGPLLKDYGNISPEDVQVSLLEGGERLLPGMPERLQAYARVRLEARRVTVCTGCQVESVGPDRVVTRDDGELLTHTVVWGAGVQGDPAVDRWGLPVGPAGRVPVQSTLQLPDHPEVFVVGDLAYLECDGRELPQVAQVALQQGRAAADNIVRLIRGELPVPFTYHDLGMMAVIGRNAAVAKLWGRTFTGFGAWILWLVIHVSNLIGFRNRALVLVNWAWNYVFYRRAVRLILPDATRGHTPNPLAGRSKREVGPCHRNPS